MRKENGIFDKVYTHKSPKTKKTEYRYRFYWYQNPEESKRHYGYSDWSTTKEKARQNAQRKIDEKYTKPIQDNRRLTIEQIAQKYVDYITGLEISENVRPTSQATLVSDMRALVLMKDEDTKRNIAHIPDNLRIRKICDFTTADMGNWLNYIITHKSEKTGKRLKKKTVNKYKKSLRKFLIFANKELNCFVDDADRASLLYQKTLEDLYIEDTSIPSTDKSDRVLNEKTFRIFMCNKFVPTGFLYEAVSGDRGGRINREYEYYILLSMLFYSGARVSEVKPLTVEDVSWEKLDKENSNRPDIYKAKVNFDKAYSEKALKATKEKHRNLNEFMKTPRAKRVIPIYGTYAKELFAYVNYLKWIYGRDYSGLLFPGEKNAVMSSNAIQNKITTRVKKNLKSLGIEKLSPHDFRASRVTEFLLTGLKPENIYWFFGHNSKKLVDGCYKRIRPQEEYEKNKDFADKENFGNEEQQRILEETIKKAMGIEN